MRTQYGTLIEGGNNYDFINHFTSKIKFVQLS